ncbi:MAG: EAL domain-containing protein [Rhodobacteraceae bacterium]|nr:EAL domain-containing protein [Paracoccaceae bacterium]
MKPETALVPGLSAQPPGMVDLGVVVELTTNLVAIVDMDQRIVWVNGAFEAQTGYRLDEVRGALLAEIVRSPDCDPVVAVQVREAIAHRRHFRGEILNQDRHGQPYWINFNIHPLVDAKGQPFGYVSVETVITDLKELEGALHAERDFLAQMIDTSISGIITLDQRGRVIMANSEACTIFEMPRDQIVGRLFTDHDWTVETLDGTPFGIEERPVQQVLTSGISVRDVRYVMRWPDGRRRVLSINASPISHPGNEARVVCIISDMTEPCEQAETIRKAAEQARFAAVHDAMTGLPNRAGLEKIVIEALHLAETKGESGALIYMDLDNFKNINDSLGSEAGDHAIQALATRLRATVRAGDVVARQAGDEFAVLLRDGISQEAAMETVDRIFEVLRQPFNLLGQTIYLTASLGITYYPADGIDSSTILQNADMAMDRAKAAGRNRFAIFTPFMRHEMSRRIAVTQALRRGLRHDHFRLVLQPKVALDNPTRAVGAEALLRWRDPVLGDVSPEEFIPLAEAAGLIRTIDLKVVAMLGELLRRWRRLARGVPVSFNLSAQSLQGEGFAKVLMSVFGTYRIQPSEVQIEITETSLMQNVAATVENITILRRAGFRTSLDDFGTGYSSLAYMQLLPLSELKIDRSFITSVGRGDASSDAIVRAILSLGKALGLEIVAEGVERDEQRDWLMAQGCPIGQGRLFGSAMEVELFEDRFF